MPLSRKLQAIDYIRAPAFAIEDEIEMRQLVAWLEDMRIRFYKLNERDALRNVKSSTWTTAFEKYLDDLQCPQELRAHTSTTIDWLLSYAIQLEHSDQFPAPNAQAKAQVDSASSRLQQEEQQSRHTQLQGEASQQPLLSFHAPLSALLDERVKKSLANLGAILKFPPSDNPLSLLKAISTFVDERLSPEAIAAAGSKPSAGDVLDLKSIPLGFTINDPLLNEAAKILRLLHISELRNLQTSVNELIVSIQSITADPKTDSALGEVGR